MIRVNLLSTSVAINYQPTDEKEKNVTYIDTGIDFNKCLAEMSNSL